LDCFFALAHYEAALKEECKLASPRSFETSLRNSADLTNEMRKRVSPGVLEGSTGIASQHLTFKRTRRKT
jgi:hypothetical protein